MTGGLQDQDGRDRRGVLLLGLGAALGLVMAAYGVLGETQSRQIPQSAVARVNGTLIRSEDYERLVAAVMDDMQSPDLNLARARVLERMIDEELLVQRALDLGLVHLDRKVRADLTSSVINAVVSDVAGDEPSDRDLRDFYADNRGYFSRPGRLRVVQIFFRNRPASTQPEGTATLSGRARAEKAQALLSGDEDWGRVEAEWGDLVYAPLPNAMLPATKIREYLGPTVLRAILELEVGETSATIESGTGLHILHLLEREPTRVPAFEEVAKQVKADWRRRRGDDALRSYLVDLRAAADIEIAAEQ